MFCDTSWNPNFPLDADGVNAKCSEETRDPAELLEPQLLAPFD